MVHYLWFTGKGKTKASPIRHSKEYRILCKKRIDQKYIYHYALHYTSPPPRFGDLTFNPGVSFLCAYPQPPSRRRCFWRRS